MSMAVSDKDIRTTARALIDKRGREDAAKHAARRIAHLQDIGDDEGAECKSSKPVGPQGCFS